MISLQNTHHTQYTVYFDCRVSSLVKNSQNNKPTLWFPLSQAISNFGFCSLFTVLMIFVLCENALIKELHVNMYSTNQTAHTDSS